jgi:hypothetical protein
MGILASAVYRRVLLNACVGSDRGYDDSVRPITIGRTGVAERRTNDTMAIQCGTRAHLVIAGRKPAKEGPAILSLADLDHDVSILITAVDAAVR